MPTLRFPIAVLLVPVVLCGCGTTTETDVDASSVDGGTRDAGMEQNHDAGRPPSDAGTDAPLPIDEDSDGVPQELDCDDTDPTVGATATRECSNACGDGNEMCEDGVWAECDAPTDCICDAPGESRIVDCGMCGMQAEQCSAEGTWEPNGACLNQGECAPTTVETVMNDLCGERQRLCDTECGWGPWNTITPDGECRPGTALSGLCPGSTRRYCGDDCQWEADCR